MTKLGKIMVVLNLALSLLFVGYALAVLGSQRVLTAPDSGQQTPPANWDQKKFNSAVESKRETDQVSARARKRWTDNMQGLLKEEKGYYGTQALFEAELKDLQEGPNNLRTLKIEDGRIVLDPQKPGIPEMIEARDGLGQPVKSAKVTRDLIKQEYDKLDDLAKILSGDPDSQEPRKKMGLIKWHESLVRQLFEELDDPNADPKSRGLRVEIEIEEQKLKQIEKETEYLEDLRNKIAVDHRSLDRRLSQMIARKKELEDKLKVK